MLNSHESSASNTMSEKKLGKQRVVDQPSMKSPDPEEGANDFMDIGEKVEIQSTTSSNPLDPNPLGLLDDLQTLQNSEAGQPHLPYPTDIPSIAQTADGGQQQSHRSWRPVQPDREEIDSGQALLGAQQAFAGAEVDSVGDTSTSNLTDEAYSDDVSAVTLDSFSPEFLERLIAALANPYCGLLEEVTPDGYPYTLLAEGPKPYVCQVLICKEPDRTFENMASLRIHQQIHQSKEDIANVQSTVEKLRSLEKLKKLDAPWFLDKKSYMQISAPNIYEVAGPEPYMCANGKCARKHKAFVLPSERLKHVKVKHTPQGWRIYVCGICPLEPLRRDFMLPKDLERHFLTHGIGEPKPHLQKVKCEHCKGEFSRIAGLIRHQNNPRNADKACAHRQQRRRARRSSAPPAPTCATASQPLKLDPIVEQMDAGLIGSHHVPGSASSSSMTSGSTRPATSSSQRRPASSSATEYSAQFSHTEDNMQIDPMLSQPSRKNNY